MFSVKNWRLGNDEQALGRDTGPTLAWIRESVAQKKKLETHHSPVTIDGRDEICTVAFLVDGRQAFSGGKEGKIRRWEIENGTEVGTPMNTGSTIRDIALSQDGKWIVGGTSDGRVTVWDTKSHNKANRFQAHNNWVNAVDVLPDATRVVTGSEDETACVWSLFRRGWRRVLGPWKHVGKVSAVKFSPNGRLIATGTWSRTSVRIYDSQDDLLLVDVPIQLSSLRNQTLAWANDSKQLFALSWDGVHCLDVSTGATLSQWAIHDTCPQCITPAGNGAFIAASSGPSVSFWDSVTHAQIGLITERTADSIDAMAISTTGDIVICSGKNIVLHSLYGILPPSYLGDENRHTESRGTGEPHHIPGNDVPEDNIGSTVEAVQQSGDQLANFKLTAKKEENVLSATINSQCSSEEEITNFERTIEKLRHELSVLRCTASQKEESLNETIRSLRARDKGSSSTIAHLEMTVQQLETQLANSRQKVDKLVQSLRMHEHAEDRIVDAAVSLLEVKKTVSEEVKTNGLIKDWLLDFKNRCIFILELNGDEASTVKQDEKALLAYSTALLLSPSRPDTILNKWAGMMLVGCPVDQVLDAAARFKIPESLLYQVVCNILEGNGQVTEAIECFRRMQGKMAAGTSRLANPTAWELDFRGRLVEKLEKLGDAAVDSQKYNEAVRHYSDALILGATKPVGILYKRSKVQASIGSWEEALVDAHKVIGTEPMSYTGYERKYAALHGMKRYKEAFAAHEVMLSKLNQFVDPHHHEISSQYVDATSTIRKVIEETIRHMPRVLIDATTGHLHDKARQASAFEELPIYDELRSSMTTRLDYAFIRREVKTFYRYVMFSHRWESGEPLFQRVQDISVYDLESSSPNIKLQTFCRLIRSLGFRWVWSDTCCIDKKDNVVLQESLVAMFTWYRCSSLTIVYLQGVWSRCQQPGGIRRSVWNTRAWTYQEYVAAETVQFYTEDWKPYLGLETFNHKESPAIISEMQQATGILTEGLVVLRPGLDRVREKLYLASARQTTLVEDIAYSLYGIFNVSLPVIYGEGNRAVGRLLEHVLTGSGDVTVLAWTGRAGSYNSYLPFDLTVYNELAPPHIPQPIETGDIVAQLRSSLSDLSLARTLYDHLNKLASPSVAASRLRLPGIVFPIAQLDSSSQSNSGNDSRVYRAMTSRLGEVEIQTKDNLSGMKNLLFIHPWISPLLDQEFSRGAGVLDDETLGLRLVARLRQPFGALLLEPVSRVQYRRVAADGLIMVRVKEETSVSELVGAIRTVDVQ